MIVVFNFHNYLINLQAITTNEFFKTFLSFMNFNDVSVLFRVLTLAQAVFVFSYLLVFKERKPSLVFFGLFLITYSIPNVSYLLNSFGLREMYPSVRFLPIGFYFACMPLFYLYTKSLLEKVQPKETFICLIPAIIDFILYTVLFFLPYELSSQLHKDYYGFLLIWYGVFLNVFSLFFVYLTLQKIFKYHKKYLHFFSNTQKTNLHWISIISYLLLFVYVFQLSSLLFEIKDSNNIVYLIDSVISLVVIYWISIFGIRQSHIPKEYEVFVQSKVSTDANINEQEYEKIVDLLNESGIYKNSNLTVVELAEKLGMHPKKVSQIINQFANKNFNHFINEFRVNEAKRLLSSPSYDQLTIEAVYKDAGFNSKSVFNTVFKEYTGHTPTAFKKEFTNVHWL